MPQGVVEVPGPTRRPGMRLHLEKPGDLAGRDLPLRKYDFGGFAFPIANMPQPVQWLTLFNPIRYFLVIVRSIFLKGVGMEVLWPQMWPLLAMGLTVLFLSIRRFHKTL